MIGYRRYVIGLGVVYAGVWAALAVAPADRATWLLENALTVGVVIALVLAHRGLPLSRISYGLIFVFGCLHAVGAHYTYSNVPYNEAAEALFGRSLDETFGWQRNHYDRLVHFCWGLLLTYPVREVLVRVADLRGFWGYFEPVVFIAASSAFYELLEWGAAMVFGEEGVGMAFLGTQGDVWDGHRDMALATLGAMIAMLVTMAVNASLNRDFNREWRDSLRVKDTRPLGEEAIARMLEERRLEERVDG